MSNDLEWFPKGLIGNTIVICQQSSYRASKIHFKVAPYSFTIARALRTKAPEICARSKEHQFFRSGKRHKFAKIEKPAFTNPTFFVFKIGIPQDADVL